MNESENQQREEVIETREIGIAGMTCDHCVRKVESALRGVNGVKEVHVDLQAALAEVRFDTTRTDLPALHDAMLRSGYQPVKRAAG